MARIVNKSSEVSGLVYSKPYVAAGNITAGYLVKVDNAGKVVVHATAGGRAMRLFADNKYDTQSGLKSTFANGDNVPIIHAKAGYELNVRIAAGASAIVKGDELESAGDGTIRKMAGTTDRIGIALAAVDNSGGGTEVSCLMLVQ